MAYLLEQAKYWALSYDFIEVNESQFSDSITLQWSSLTDFGFDWTIQSDGASDITISTSEKFGVFYTSNTAENWLAITGLLNALLSEDAHAVEDYSVKLGIAYV